LNKDYGSEQFDHFLSSFKLSTKDYLLNKTEFKAKNAHYLSLLNFALYAKAKFIHSSEAFRLTTRWLITVAQQFVILTRFPSVRPPIADNLEVRGANVTIKCTWKITKNGNR
jgi:hypothetical protein